MLTKKLLTFCCKIIFCIVFFVFSAQVLSAQQIFDMVPAATPDRDFICKGQTATITIVNANYHDGTGDMNVVTENTRNEYYGGMFTGCTLLKEITPDISGGNYESMVITRRACGDDPTIRESRIVITVRPTETTTYTISWEAEVHTGADLLRGTSETVDRHFYYTKTLTIAVSSDEPPVLKTPKLSVNQNDPAPLITVKGKFESRVRGFSWWVANCDNTAYTLFDNTAPFSAPQDTSYNFAQTNLLGTIRIAAKKIDSTCPSALSEPINITVKPCNSSPTGCNAELVADIEKQSCSPEAEARNDHHFYTREKTLCKNCDLEHVWQRFKSDIHNQAIELGDAVPFFESTLGGAKMAFMNALFPSTRQKQPITDCEVVDLPRFSTYAIKAGLMATDRNPRLHAIFEGFAFIQDACAVEGKSYTDPIFMKIDESNKCVINYTLPGHILYPGKVTRCLVKECGEVRIKTFGEGTTLFPGDPCGWLLKNMNQLMGQVMFKNVDDRFERSLQDNGINRMSSVHANTRESGAGYAYPSVLLNNWKVKKLQMKYIGSDSLFTFYTNDDTSNFFNLRNLRMNLLPNGQYEGDDVAQQAAAGAWSYDTVNSKFITDADTVDMVSMHANEFTIKGIAPIMRDTVPSTAEYFMTFYSGLTALPVTIANFTARAVGCSMLLNLETTGELHVKQFELQRSATGSGVWNTLSILQAVGTTNLPMSYRYTDNAPVAGSNYYRVKTVDLDGQVSYSAIIVATANNCVIGLVTSYPNPFSDVLTVSLPSGVTSAKVQLINMFGQVVYINDHVQRTFTLNTGNLAIGTYALTVTDGHSVNFKQKLVKSK